MNINWEELIKGASDTLAASDNNNKQAGFNPVGLARGTRDFMVGIPGAIQEGARVLRRGGRALAALPGQAMGLLPMLGAFGGGAGGAAGVPAATGALGGSLTKRSLIPKASGTASVYSLAENPMAIADFHNIAPTKVAGAMFDSLAWAAQNRAANAVLNSTTGTTPTGQVAGRADGRAGQALPTTQELEIISKYPELQEILEHPENKAYLERLLQEKQ